MIPSAMAKVRQIPAGCLYRNGKRWWYKVRLPGEQKPSFFPLVPPGLRFATRNKNVAAALARQLYRRKVQAVPQESMAALLARFEAAERMTGGPRHVRQKVQAVKDFRGAMDLSNPAEITPAIVQNYLAELHERGLSPKTIVNVRANIGRFCQFLVMQDELESNPVKRTRPPKVPHVEPKCLTRREITTALRLARKIGCLAEVALAYYAGLRLGEIMRLRWGDVRGAGRRKVLVIGSTDPTKGNRPRSVPVCKKLAAILAGMPRGKPDELIFPARSRRTWARMLDPIKAKVSTMDREGGGWHDFRRSCGGMLVQSGATIFQVAKILGHRDVRTTVRSYAHLRPEHGRGVLEKL